MTPSISLAEAWPVVLDPAQYERARRLGLAGRLRAMQFEAVVFRGARFEIASGLDDQAGGEIAFVFPARDPDAEIADAVAWIPETGKTATLLGAVGTLGLQSLGGPRMAPMVVYETIVDWLADPDGLLILEPRLAASELDGVTLMATDVDAGLRLRAKLAPHCTRAPKIKVMRKAA